MRFDGRSTALVFPAAGSHWPGMAEELYRGGSPLLERAAAVIGEFGRSAADLERLFAGQGQAGRERGPEGWSWTGDYPLSVAAQTVVSVAHAEAFVARFGPPRIMLGESMGEIAAYVLAGVLSFEDALRVGFHYAEALVGASARAGDLRLGLAVKLDLPTAERIAAAHRAEVAIYEALNQFVLSAPAARIEAIEAAVREAKGCFIVSVQPCTAHDPRLAGDRAWPRYAEILDRFAWSAPRIPIASTLDPGACLERPAALRANFHDTAVHPVRWAEAISRLFWFPEEGAIHTLVQVCTRASAVVLERLKPQGVVLAGVRVAAVGRLADLDP